MKKLLDHELNQFLVSKIIPLLPNPNTKQGNNYFFRCPVCGDSKKSLIKKRGTFYSSNPANFHCFNCDVSLSAFDFLKFLSNEDFKSLMTEFNRQKINVFSNSKNKIEDFIINLEKPIVSSTLNLQNLDEDEIEYLKKRKIYELPFFEKLHFQKIIQNKYDFIFIPWIKHNQVVTYQIHNYKKIKNYPKYRFQNDSKKIVYGLDRIDPAFKFIICFEGVFDSLFVKNGVALGSKVLMKSQKEEILSRFPYHEIVFAFDFDESGIKTTLKYVNNYKLNAKFFLWFLNDKVKKGGIFKDINEFIMKTDFIDLFDESFIKRNIFSSIETKFELNKQGIR